MASYLRTIKIPQRYFADVIDSVALQGGKIHAKMTSIYNEPYALISIVSAKPLIVPRVSAVAVEKNSTSAEATAFVHRKIYVTDLDLHGVLTYDWSNTTLTTSGTDYSVDISVLDRDGVSKTITLPIKVVDTLIPIITVTSTVNVDYTDIATYTPSASAVDNVSDNISANIVFTYFAADGTTAIASLAAFRTYLDNSGEGDIVGIVKCNVEDADGNKAATKTITVTAGAKT